MFENTLIRRILKNSGYLFSATGISAALSMLQSVFTARMLGVAGFGLFGTISMFTSVVNKFASFRMGELVVKYVGRYSEAGDTRRAAAVFKAAALAETLASLIAFAFILLLAPLGARYFAKDPGLSGWFSLYGLIILANLISESSTGLLQIFDRFRRMAYLTVVQSGVTLALIALAYFASTGLIKLPYGLHQTLLSPSSFHPGLLPVILAYVAGKVIGALGLTAAAVQEAGRRWGAGWWKTPLNLLGPEMRELAHFGVTTNISASLSLINKDSELLFVAFFRGEVETGFYRLALGLANLVQMPVSPLPAATYPELSRESARRNWASVRQILNKGSLLAGGYSLAAVIGLTILGRPLIRLLYGEEFLPAFPALVILLIGFLVANTLYWNRTALLALGRPDFPTRVNLALAVAKIAGILLLVPRFGYLANAALLAGSYIVGTSLCAWKVNQLVTAQETALPPTQTQEEAVR